MSPLSGVTHSQSAEEGAGIRYQSLGRDRGWLAERSYPPKISRSQSKTLAGEPPAPRACATRSLSHPLVHPIIHRLVPELRILRFEHPVSFVGEVEHLRRHSLPLQSREQIESL